MEPPRLYFLSQKFTFYFAVMYNLCVLCTCTEDYHTSPIGIQKLIKVEQKLLIAASEYATTLENRINKIKRYLEDYETSVVARMQNGPITNAKETSVKIYDKKSDLVELAEKVSAHPLITYRLIRRFAIELKDLERDMGNNVEKKFLMELEKVRKGLPLPQPKDLKGAVEGLLRVQDAYDLNVTEFSQGNLMGLATHSGLTAADCYEIGTYALKSNIYNRAVEWLERAYHMITVENDRTWGGGETKKALEEAIHQHDLVQMQNPKHLYVFNRSIKSIANIRKSNETLHRAFAETEHILYQDFESLMDLWNFRALCSGKVLQSSLLTKDLTCSYQASGDIPILLEKVEMLSLKPPVIQIYDVLSDSAIETILEKAAPMMSRSKVQGTVTGQQEVASVVRTSTTTWIHEPSEPILAKIPRRIQGITGLNMLGFGDAEDLQVSSYGIGGHYNPHFDTVQDPQYLPILSKDEISRGDRVATFMFYLSTLEKGGGTAFPRLGVITEPIKRSAVFWFNLREDGTRHPFSLHGGCPVLYGTKHVANKWIRANSQMFKRQCSLQPGI